MSADGARWALINVSPEIRAQIDAFPGLHPHGPRRTPIGAILLTSGDLDHCLGLLSLREDQRLRVYATPAVRRSFVDDNRLARTLDRFPGHVTWEALVPGRAVDLRDADGDGLGIRVTPVSVPGKPPIHAEAGEAPSPEDNVALMLEDGFGRRLAYASGAGELTPELLAAVDGADALFFDGTFWSEDELPSLGLGTKRAAQMAHLPIGGPSGSLARLGGLEVGRRIYIHINNTNPILREDSPERAAVEAAGWEVAVDGMELSL